MLHIVKCENASIAQAQLNKLAELFFGNTADAINFFNSMYRHDRRNTRDYVIKKRFPELKSIECKVLKAISVDADDLTIEGSNAVEVGKLFEEIVAFEENEVADMLMIFVDILFNEFGRDHKLKKLFARSKEFNRIKQCDLNNSLVSSVFKVEEAPKLKRK